MKDCSKTVPVCELIQENPHLSLKSKMNNKQHLNFLFRVLKYFFYECHLNISLVQISKRSNEARPSGVKVSSLRFEFEISKK